MPRDVIRGRITVRTQRGNPSPKSQRTAAVAGGCPAGANSFRVTARQMWLWSSTTHESQLIVPMSNTFLFYFGYGYDLGVYMLDLSIWALGGGSTL